MKRRDRLMATLRGDPVDRPPVSFYELNGLDQDPLNTDPFNIYRDPSWRPLLDLTRAKTDLIVMRGVAWVNAPPNPLHALIETESVIHDGSRLTTSRLRTGRRVLTSRSRQDPDVNTVWTLEHLLKDTDDLRAFIDLPVVPPGTAIDPTPVLQAESALGDTGIVMIDTPDPLCCAASLFDMAQYTVIAMTDPALFHRLLERYAAELLPKTEAVAKALPGRLWRIYGPEYASPPYLPPHLFRDYVGRYVAPMIQSIQRFGGYARIHSHGNLNAILPDIAAMGADALDPIEPPPQGDVELLDVRTRYGKQLVLFGNLEISDIENLPAGQFEETVKRAIEEGTAGTGRGFVLMPSAAPYGRHISARTLTNYETIVRVMERL